MAKNDGAKTQKKPRGQCCVVGCTRDATTQDGFCAICDRIDRAALYEDDTTEGRRSPLGVYFMEYWRPGRN